MTGTRFRNRFLKEATRMNRLAYKKKKKSSVSLMRENKKQCPGSLDVTRITDKINFWRVVEPNFSDSYH